MFNVQINVAAALSAAGLALLFGLSLGLVLLTSAIVLGICALIDGP